MGDRTTHRLVLSRHVRLPKLRLRAAVFDALSVSVNFTTGFFAVNVSDLAMVTVKSCGASTVGAKVAVVTLPTQVSSRAAATEAPLLIIGSEHDGRLTPAASARVPHVLAEQTFLSQTKWSGVFVGSTAHT